MARTAGERLGILLPWLNAEPTYDHPQERFRVLRRLKAFVDTFDGSAESGFVEYPHRGRRRRSAPSKLTPRERKELAALLREEFGPPEVIDLDQLQANLRLMLEQGFDTPVDAGMMPLPGLAFSVRGTGRVRTEKGTAARQAHNVAGAYILQVVGPLAELVTFFVLHLLTQPGAASIGRCRAPAPYSKERCGKFIVTQTKGRPREFCEGPACRKRAYQESTR